MCPSFQATRDEKDSTRGRANMLRLAITGQLGLEGFTDPHVHEVLDLCLECKACKNECPTNVDMARLKAEFLHQFYRKYGLPWRNRLFGHVAKLGQVGCSTAPLSNWLVRSRLARWLNEKLLGIDRRAYLRHLPAKRSDSDSGPWREITNWLRMTFRRVVFRSARSSFRGAKGDSDFRPVSNGTGQPVLLFPDTFTNYFEPEIGEAAIDLLRRTGCSVTLGPPGLALLRPAADLQRPARRGRGQRSPQRRTALSHGPEPGRPIIACEPSCILTIRDDYPALLRGELRAQAEAVANACRTFEEFLESILGDLASPRLAVKAGPRRILVQAHCHQRSLVGVGTDAAGASSHPGSDGDRPRRRLLRHGRLVRLRGRALRRLATGRRAAALAGAAPGRAGRRHRRAGVLMPAPDPALHRTQGGSSRRAVTIATSLSPAPAGVG